MHGALERAGAREDSIFSFKCLFYPKSRAQCLECDVRDESKKKAYAPKESVLTQHRGVEISVSLVLAWWRWGAEVKCNNRLIFKSSKGTLS